MQQSLSLVRGLQELAVSSEHLEMDHVDGTGFQHCHCSTDEDLVCNLQVIFPLSLSATCVCYLCLPALVTCVCLLLLPVSASSVLLLLLFATSSLLLLWFFPFYAISYRQ